MNGKAAMKWASWISIVALISTSVPFVLPSRAAAQGTCYDEIDDRTYSDCPPDDLVQGKSRRERSELLKYWQSVNPDVKKAYRDYVDCKNEVARLVKELKDIGADVDARYDAAKEKLKLALIGVTAKLGLQVSQITTNALADAVLFGKALRDAIKDEGGAKQKATAEVEAKGSDAQNKLYEAAKSKQYLASLQAEVDKAIARLKAAEAREAAALPPGDGDGRGAPPAGGGGDKGTPPSGGDNGRGSPPKGGDGGGRTPPPEPDYSRSTPTQFFAMDPENPRFWVDALVERGPGYHPQGEIAMSFRTELLDATGKVVERSRVLAMFQMFGEALDHLSGQFGAIRSRWQSDLPSQLNIFNDAIRNNMTPEQAALQTPTGRLAARRGFTQAKIHYELCKGSPGNYTDVEVTFFRPGDALR